MRIVYLGLILLAGCAHAGKKRYSNREREEGDGGSSKKHHRKESHDAYGAITLNGTETPVRWTDGDSFNIQDGPYKGHGTRMVGYNTLEAYGPVHRWGTWTPEELYEIARSASKIGASQKWECTSDGKVDGYKRLLIRCPEAVKEFIRQGAAMVYSVPPEKPNAELLAIEREAQAKKLGMWAKGVPEILITSLHSTGEDEGQAEDHAYNRWLDVKTGVADMHQHSHRYKTCEWVCEGGDNGSCMLYVPFKHRYRAQPDCLLPKSGTPPAPDPTEATEPH